MSRGLLVRACCPVCESTEIQREHWKIPMSPLAQELQINGAHYKYAPLLDPEAPLYIWARCTSCGSVFIDPHADERDRYRRSQYHAGKFDPQTQRPITAGGYEARWKHISTFLPTSVDASPPVLLDAGCGAGQYLWAAHASRRFPGGVIGLELAEASVQAINTRAPDHELRAIQADLDEPEWIGQLQDAPGYGIGRRLVDFIIFSEAFEHVENPRAVCTRLVSLLRPGGRMYFTAQSPHGKLPIRPGEPIYATHRGLHLMLRDMGVRELHFELSAGRWTIVIEKLHPEG